jgi:hypothetical protein
MVSCLPSVTLFSARRWGSELQNCLPLPRDGWSMQKSKRGVAFGLLEADKDGGSQGCGLPPSQRDSEREKSLLPRSLQVGHGTERADVSQGRQSF